MRQGNPLPLLLFVIVMNTVGRMLDKAVNEGRIEGCSLVMSHLLFADDTLIFCDTDHDQLLLLRMVLIWFEAVSSLKINLRKLELVPVGVVPNIMLLLDVLGCKQGSLSMKYLGLPLGANFEERMIWNPILEVERRLAG